MKKLRIGTMIAGVLAVLLLVLPLAAASDTNAPEDPSYTPAPTPVSNSGDMVLARYPIPMDDADGVVKVRLYLIYKNSNVISGDRLSMFHIVPKIDSAKMEDYPFEITYGHYRQTLKELKEGAPLAQDDMQWLGGVSRYFEFVFKTKNDAINGYYNLDFDVTYIGDNQSVSYQKPVTDTLSTYVKIVHGKPPATATPSPTPSREVEPTPKPQAKLILSASKMTPERVVSGDTFDLTLTLENTHKDMDVRNIKCSLKAEDKTSANVLPASGSNSFFIDEIEAGGTHSVTIQMVALPDAGAKPEKLILEMEYVDKNDKNTVSEEITLPISQDIKVKLDEPFYDTQQYADQPFNISLNFYNVGKAKMNNTMVTLESDTMKADENYFAGNVEPGGTASYDVMVTVPASVLPMPEMAYPEGEMPEGAAPGLDYNDGEAPQLPKDANSDGSFGAAPASELGQSVSIQPAIIEAIGGPGMGGGGSSGPGMGTECTGNIVITYEDAYGTEFREEVPVTVWVENFNMGQIDVDNPFAGMDFDWNRNVYVDRETGDLYDPETGLKIERGVNPLVLIGAGVGVVIVVIVLIVVIVQVRKKAKLKKMERELEHEVE